MATKRDLEFWNRQRDRAPYYIAAFLLPLFAWSAIILESSPTLSKLIPLGGVVITYVVYLYCDGLRQQAKQEAARQAFLAKKALIDSIFDDHETRALGYCGKTLRVLAPLAEIEGGGYRIKGIYEELGEETAITGGPMAMAQFNNLLTGDRLRVSPRSFDRKPYYRDFGPEEVRTMCSHLGHLRFDRIS